MEWYNFLHPLFAGRWTVWMNAVEQKKWESEENLSIDQIGSGRIGLNAFVRSQITLIFASQMKSAVN